MSFCGRAYDALPFVFALSLFSRELKLNCLVIIHKPLPGVSQPALARFTERARRAARLHGEVNVLLTSGSEVRLLNRRYRGQNKATDVLSFPPIPTIANDFAGDIVIAADVAAGNARRLGHEAQQEIKVLILHAVLHLAGYDHESDSGQMARREERLRQALGLSSGLIARANGAGGPSLSRGRAKRGGRPGGEQRRPR